MPQSHLTSEKKIVWTIAGADCSGGAGIAADIKTLHLLGCEACHLITANTVQNSTTVSAVYPVAVTVLMQQAKVLMDDKAPHAIKIGLIANGEQLQWLVSLVGQMKVQNPALIVVFDPVAQASSGGQLSGLSSAQLMSLLPLVDVLTPNLAEAQEISARDSDNIEELARAMISVGVNQVIVKGGHSSGAQSTDHAVSANKTLRLASKRIATAYSHGGGCSFASALTAFLAQGYLFRDAFTLAKAYMQQGLRSQQHKLDYYGAFEQLGWPVDVDDFPTILAPVFDHHGDKLSFPAMDIKRDGRQVLGLYPVVDSVQWLERLIPLGINIIQLRLKNLCEQQLRREIAAAVTLSQHYQCRLFINDYWQLAIEYGAYGVHLGQEDLLDADLAMIAAAGLRLGISTHGCYEFLLAQQLKPSYLAVGAIFPTKTKDMTGQIQGLENLTHLLNLATDIPVVAIGGISLERAADVWQTGVDSIAVVTAITQASSPEQAVRDFQHLCLQQQYCVSN